MDVIADTRSKDWQPLASSVGNHNMMLQRDSQGLQVVKYINNSASFLCYYFDFEACNHILVTEEEGCMSSTAHGDTQYQKCVWSHETYTARFKDKKALSVFLTPQIKQAKTNEFYWTVFGYVIVLWVFCVCGTVYMLNHVNSTSKIIDNGVNY